MDKFWNWLVVSSADPEKYSLTIKAVGAGLVTVLTVVLGFARIPAGDFTPVVDGLVVVVQAFFGLVSALAFLYGVFRKLYLTWQRKSSGAEDDGAQE